MLTLLICRPSLLLLLCSESLSNYRASLLQCVFSDAESLQPFPHSASYLRGSKPRSQLNFPHPWSHSLSPLLLSLCHFPFLLLFFTHGFFRVVPLALHWCLGRGSLRFAAVLVPVLNCLSHPLASIASHLIPLLSASPPTTPSAIHSFPYFSDSILGVFS